MPATPWGEYEPRQTLPIISTVPRRSNIEEKAQDVRSVNGRPGQARKSPPVDPGRASRVIEFSVRAFQLFCYLDTVQVLSYTPLSLSAQEITGGASGFRLSLILFIRACRLYSDEGACAYCRRDNDSTCKLLRHCARSSLGVYGLTRYANSSFDGSAFQTWSGKCG